MKKNKHIGSSFDNFLREEGLLAEAKFPPGWDEARVREVIAHYENQSEKGAIVEDETGRQEGR